MGVFFARGPGEAGVVRSPGVVAPGTAVLRHFLFIYIVVGHVSPEFVVFDRGHVSAGEKQQKSFAVGEGRR